MLNLLKCDLLRIIKDKLFLAVCIVGGCFVLFINLFNHLLFNVLLETGEVTAVFVSGQSLFYGAYAPGANFGLVVPILITIALCKDFTHGTVRNKIISGKSRLSVFLSMFLATTIIITGVMTVYAFLTLLVSLPFFEYYNAELLGPMAEGVFVNALITVLLYLLVYVFISAFVSFLCVVTRSSGISVLIYVATSLFLGILGSVASASSVMVDQKKTVLVGFLKFISDANVYSTSVIGAADYVLSDTAYVLIWTIGASVLFLLFGFLSFRRKDLK